VLREVYSPDANPESTSVDGRVGHNSTSAVWATVHDATDGTFADDSTATQVTAVASGLSGGNFYIMRPFYLFDTSTLSGKSVTAATLRIYVAAKEDSDNDGDDWVNVVQSSPASNTALTTADYDQCGSVSNPTEGATRQDITGISTSAYLSFDLNATGLGWINTGGVTKLGLREGHDAINSAYAGANGTFNLIDSYMSEQAGVLVPVLYVDYSATSVKTWNGLANASIKTVNGLARASAKTIKGVT
jgi:hypothetical protein